MSDEIKFEVGQRWEYGPASAPSSLTITSVERGVVHWSFVSAIGACGEACDSIAEARMSACSGVWRLPRRVKLLAVGRDGYANRHIQRVAADGWDLCDDPIKSIPIRRWLDTYAALVCPSCKVAHDVDCLASCPERTAGIKGTEVASVDRACGTDATVVQHITRRDPADVAAIERLGAELN